MDFYKAFTSEVIRNRKKADNEFTSFYREATPDNWDSELFFKLTLNHEMANSLDQDHAKIVNQSLKTTIDHFN
jgi:hypothetical protein